MDRRGAERRLPQAGHLVLDERVRRIEQKGPDRGLRAAIQVGPEAPPHGFAVPVQLPPRVQLARAGAVEAFGEQAREHRQQKALGLSRACARGHHDVALRRIVRGE